MAKDKKKKKIKPARLEPTPPVFEDPVSYVSLSLGYQFAKDDPDNYDYMLLNPEQKSLLDFTLVQQLGRAFTFADRTAWIELPNPSESGFYSQDDILAIINEQLRELVVPGKDGYRAWVGAASKENPADDPDEPHGQAIYLIIPPREHRTVYNYPIHLSPEEDGLNASSSTIWRLNVTVDIPGVKPNWNPCVCASFSAGVNIPENAMTPQDRIACRMNSFFEATAEVIEEMAEKMGVSTPDDFGNPSGMQDPHAFDQFKKDAEEMRSRMNARKKF